MKQMLLKFLKVFLIVVAVILALLLVFGVVLSLDWPWWVGFFVLLGLVGIGVGVLFIRKLLLRRREQDFVQEVIAQDDSYLKGLDDKERQRSKELQGRWKEAIETLKHSHLKKYGNPLYVLPWYVVIGESGSGKTTAISSAGLSSPFAEVSRISGISGTRNCDWWFFEQAILIDTAGRYAIPVDEGRDKDEWQNFLGLLAKFRKKEPLNGLVVTVAANKLLESGGEVLQEDGRNIRRRVDELMRVLGTKFPVYLLVTKCDLVQGMTQFCDHLPEKGVNQAMGLVNHDLSRDVSAFYERAVGGIANRLRDLRLLLFHKSDSKEPGQSVDPGLLLFPEEFEKLKSGLDSFIKGAFQENPYQETPLLRGLFFSSGRQEGSPYSHFLNALGLIQERDILPGTNRGLFLHDFFGRILPQDRHLFAPTRRAIEWNRLTRNLGLTAWVAVVIAVCGLLSFSFVKNLKTLRHVSHEFSKPIVFEGNVLSDVVRMDHFLNAIVRVEDENKNWWIPRFGLDESEEVEIELKDKYCKQFKEAFLAPFDKKMANKMSNFSFATSDEMLGQHVSHLARRVNLLRTRLEEKDLEMLQTMPQPSYTPIVVMANQEVIPEIRKKFSDLYLHYLVWRQDSAELNREMNELQTWLKHVLTLKGRDLNWIIAWANSGDSVRPVRLEGFWKGSLEISDEIMVAPAFTLEGKDLIDVFLKEIESALTDPLVIAGKKLEFQGWYRKAYLVAWNEFAAYFPKGMARLQGTEERQQLAAIMGTDKGPYFSFLEKMCVELKPWKDGLDLPSWAELAYEFKATKLKAAQQAVMKEKGALLKVTRKGKSLINRLESKMKRLDKNKNLESELIAVKSFGEYQKALSEITPASASRSVAYEMAAHVYKEDPATGKSPFFAAQSGVNKLKLYMGEGKSEQKVFWRLVTGPLDYLWYFVRIETGCHLQELWEKEVLVELQGVSSQKSANQILLGEDGYATKFIKGSAAPFVSRSLRKGYHAKKALGERIPFEASFLSFLTKGAKIARPVQGDYAVSIRGLPTDTNKGAKLRAHATRLEVQCANETLSLVNLNYPVGKTFDWSPQDCGDVIFQIKVGKLVLTKKYSGYQGFPKFLKDFSKGQRTFYPSEFPGKEAALKRLGIKYIKATYRLKGHKPVLKLLGAAPGRVPRDIVTCWDQ
ncbi:MAG: type VI secretion system protein ImpL [Deltaproteobacteria bacterium]|nr:type VI secretion system protein ImpL [Deltaproteobacteria bacterium]